MAAEAGVRGWRKQENRTAFPLFSSLSCLGCKFYGRFLKAAGLNDQSSDLNSNACSNQSVVFIVHGFRSDSSSVNQMARVLATQHQVFPVDLDITFQNLGECVAQLKNIVVRTLQKHPFRRIHFVAHSTGGIIVRMLLKMTAISNKTAACVFIAVPNNGTVLAEAHQIVVPEPLRGIHKPIAYLTRDFVRSLDLDCPPHIAYGGVAGLKPWQTTRRAFRGPNDGVVAVSSVYLDEMVDFVQVPSDHLMIMRDFATAQAVLMFLDTFCFPSTLSRATIMNTADKFRFICENHAMDILIQSCSVNIEMATLGGKVWWRELAVVDGWKLQQNNLTSHVRILNPSDIRKAWGSRKLLDDAMDLVVSQIRSQKFVADYEDSPLVARLKKLKLLLDKELITPEEFEVRKSKILDEI